MDIFPTALHIDMPRCNPDLQALHKPSTRGGIRRYSDQRAVLRSPTGHHRSQCRTALLRMAISRSTPELAPCVDCLAKPHYGDVCAK